MKLNLFGKKEGNCCKNKESNHECCGKNHEHKDGCCSNEHDKDHECCGKNHEHKEGCCDGHGKGKNQFNCDAPIKILGSGCAKCNALEDNTKEAMKQLNIEAKVGHVTDFSLIAKYGVMSTPALVIKEKVVSSGRVLTVEEAKEILSKEF